MSEDENFVVYKDYSFENPDIISDHFKTPEQAYGRACEDAAHEAAISSLESACSPCACAIVVDGAALKVTLSYGDGETCLYSVMSAKEAEAKLNQS